MSPPQNSGMTDLSAQMGGMDLGGGTMSAPSRQKKKDRHAYHTFDTPGGSQSSSGTLQGGTGATAQFLNQTGQQITPAMSQFPASAGTSFTGQAASPMQHAARSGTPLVGNAITSTQGRVDPEQIPSIPRSRDAAAAYYLQNLYPTMEQHIPPPAAVPFVAYDQGNCSPKNIRLSLNTIPTTSDAFATTGLPLGMILQPLAPLQEGEQPIPVLDFGDAGPPRCRRCRTYINPFMQFRTGGNKFVCNMCTFANDVASEYYAPTDPSGVRVDRLQRPELSLGTVEFTVPK
ncbi:hypothetical protein LTS18_001447, partial [Coniosporium uncinatum]